MSVQQRKQAMGGMAPGSALADGEWGDPWRIQLTAGTGANV